ncbi:hypothetical protein CRG98_013478, partial [Punica granatum]
MDEKVGPPLPSAFTFPFVPSPTPPAIQCPQPALSPSPSASHFPGLVLSSCLSLKGHMPIVHGKFFDPETPKNGRS